MKLKTSILSGLMALALLFSFAAVKEAKASQPDNIGFSYDIFMGDGEVEISQDGFTRICKVYCQNGKQCGTITWDFTNYQTDGTVAGTLETPKGVIKVLTHESDGVAVIQDNLMLTAAEHGDILKTTGAFQGVTSLLCRCVFELGADGLPEKCLNCLYSLIRD